MRWIWMALLVMLSAGAVASEMWRWVDERGVVHFSDRPHPGAERVTIQPPQTFTLPEQAPRAAPAAEEPPPPPVRQPLFVYTRLSILSPAEGEVLWNIGTELNVQLAVEPPLVPQHVLRVFLDGTEVENVPQGSTQFTVGGVYRGERRLRVAIADELGRELASTDPVVFFVQQASLLNPNRPPAVRPVPRPTPGGG
jgi:hypothetical protein